MSENKDLQRISEEIEQNKNKIESDKTNIKPNKGFNFADKNYENILKIEEQNYKERIKKDKKKNKILTWISIGLCVSLIVVIILGMNKDKLQRKNIGNISNSAQTTVDLSKSKVLSGKDMFDITCNIEDARIINRELQVKYAIINKSKNTYYPLVGKSELTDINNKPYQIMGGIMPDKPEGIKPKESVEGLLIFDYIEGEAKDFKISIYGSDIEHFTFNFEIPFSIN